MTDDTDRIANTARNTDRELWRGPDEGAGDYYADSIFVTENGAIGINCGGHVIVRPLREWHAIAALELQVAALRKALVGLAAYARWQVLEGMGYHPTLPSALSAADAALALPAPSPSRVAALVEAANTLAEHRKNPHAWSVWGDIDIRVLCEAARAVREPDQAPCGARSGPGYVVPVTQPSPKGEPEGG